MGSPLRVHTFTLAALLANILVSGQAVFSQDPSGLAGKVTDEGVLITDAGKKILFFQTRPKSRDGKYTRAAYVHPLWDLDGNVLTEDFPDDHKHHRGVFWAWHQLAIGGKQIGDPWTCKDFLAEVREVSVAALDEGTLRLQVVSFWKSPEWTDPKGKQKDIIEERAVVLVQPVQRDARVIEFVIQLTAQEDDVRIGGSDDVKGYGGFSARLRSPDNLKFRLKFGPVEPQRTSVEASPWLDMTAAFGEGSKLSGVSVLTHPSTPGYPQRWILRQKRSMQNPVFPGRETVAVRKDKPLAFRYRMVLHREEATPETVNAWQSEFEKTE